jgi:hypothetical protein
VEIGRPRGTTDAISFEESDPGAGVDAGGFQPEAFNRLTGETAVPQMAVQTPNRQAAGERSNFKSQGCYYAAENFRRNPAPTLPRTVTCSRILVGSGTALSRFTNEKLSM